MFGYIVLMSVSTRYDLSMKSAKALILLIQVTAIILLLINNHAQREIQTINTALSTL